MGESSAHMLKSPGMTGVGIKKKTEWLITVVLEMRRKDPEASSR